MRTVSLSSNSTGRQGRIQGLCTSACAMAISPALDCLTCGLPPLLFPERAQLVQSTLRAVAQFLALFTLRSGLRLPWHVIFLFPRHGTLDTTRVRIHLKSAHFRRWYRRYFPIYTMVHFILGGNGRQNCTWVPTNT